MSQNCFEPIPGGIAIGETLIPDQENAPVFQAPTATLPADYVEDVKVEEHGLQLIVSTKEHVLRVKMVHAGKNSVQCIGTMADASLDGVTRILVQHKLESESRRGESERDFGGTYGTGRPLGSGGEAMPRQTRGNASG